MMQAEQSNYYHTIRKCPIILHEGVTRALIAGGGGLLIYSQS